MNRTKFVTTEFHGNPCRGKVAEKLAEARKRDPKATLFSEGIVNVIGYEHIQSGDAKGALEILKLNATAYPASANVYDSLSDAYLADGQKDLAREYAQKTLEKLATDSTTSEERQKLIRESAERKRSSLERSNSTRRTSDRFSSQTGVVLFCAPSLCEKVLTVETSE